MCLGELARVLAVDTAGIHPTLVVVDLDGGRRRRAVALYEDPAVGDVALAHSGFALRRLDEVEASQAAALRSGDHQLPSDGDGHHTHHVRTGADHDHDEVDARG